MAADGPVPDALAFLEGFMQWHRQAPFGASAFFIASDREVQILGVEQKIKNF